MVIGTLNQKSLYVKGTMHVKCFDPATNNLLYFSKEVSTNQLQSSINAGAINAGIGNPVVIQIPDTPSLTLNLTTADFSLEGRALAVGSTVTYNGVVPVDEAIEASGTTLTVTQPPVAPLGSCDVVCYINNDGTAYTIDPDSMQVQGFQAQSGTTYCVHYYTQSANSKQFAVETLINPAVVRTLITLPVFATDGNATASNTGSRAGTLYITIPRLQFSADISTDGSQTTPATTIMNGTALSYNEACENGIVCGSSASPKLAYMVLELDGTPDQFVSGLAIVGGNELDAVYDTPLPIPVKYVMQDGSIATPLMTNLTFEVAPGGTDYITVSPAGVVTGIANGTGTVNITSKYNTQLTTTAEVTVTGAPVPTANVTFALTTPSPDGSNTIEGGGATKTVTVTVQNATESVVITATKTSSQNIAVSGTDSSDVTPGGSGTNPTYTVDTSGIASAGGTKTFVLTVSESDKTSITYNVTVTVAGA